MPAVRTKTKLNNISKLDLAWLAGLLEGEGSFMSIKSHGRLRPRIAMQSTDFDVLERAHRITGVGSLYKIGDRPGKKPCWQWMVQANHDTVSLMKLLLPFMGQRRSEAIRSALVQNEW